MVATRLAKPARKPVAGRRVSRAKPGTIKSAKPSKPKPSSAKPSKAEPSKTKPSKVRRSIAKRASAKLPEPEQTEKTRASVAARKATMGRTLRRVDDTPVATDGCDDAANAGVDKQRARQTSARGEDDPSARVKRTAVERLDDPPPATGPLLIERVTRAIERELSLIEVIVGSVRLKGHQRTEAERRARTLASLARTLGEVTRLRAGQEKVKAADDDAVPRDLDEFRRTLSRRLEQLVAGPTALPAPGNE